jgi:GrpB-like predicted nucleotidyltransferase (UPF0157 family)
MSPEATEHLTPLTADEDLAAITVGTLIPHNAPVTLVEYDPQWPALFDREAARIRAVLGEEAVLVEHAGSTSVPGLPAKPIIDIVLAVPDSADEQAYVPALEAAGYVLRIREPDWFEHRLFKGPDTNINLHVFTVGAAEIDRMLLFRDWLAPTAKTAKPTCRPSATWPGAPGATFSTTPTPRPPSSSRSWPAPPPPPQTQCLKRGIGWGG